jgi:hypothetical protein
MKRGGGEAAEKKGDLRVEKRILRVELKIKNNSTSTWTTSAPVRPGLASFTYEDTYTVV